MSGRRERVRVANRARILDVARDIVAAEGASALTIRRVAAEIDYTAPVVYQHYADKAALLDAVMADAYQRLADCLRDSQTLTRSGDPKSLVEAYLGFAESNRRIFQFMHGMGGVDIPPQRRLEAAADVVEVTGETIVRWRAGQQRALVAMEVRDQAELLWATATGLASVAFLVPDGFGRARALTVPALEPLLMSWVEKDS